MGQRIMKITEAQYNAFINGLDILNEQLEDEGIKFNTDRNNNTTAYYKPGTTTNIDDKIFNDDKSLRVRMKQLPKSGVISYNLYDITNMKVNRALKHHQDMNGRRVQFDNSMNQFITRSVMYIKHIIGNNQVDIITYPQSSSDFNKEITSKLLSMYPNSDGIQIKPELLVKNVRNIYVNVDIAKEIGLSDSEIHNLQMKVEKWKKEEDIRDVRRKMDTVKQEIANIIATRKRGRPSNAFKEKQTQLQNYENDINYLRRGMKGKDPTVDANTGLTKNWQIKSIDDRHRRSIEGIFSINPQYQNIQYKLKGKHIILFDDNISSGATLDDVCLALQNLGVASIMAFTLGTIEPTIYDRSSLKMN